MLCNYIIVIIIYKLNEVNKPFSYALNTPLNQILDTPPAESTPMLLQNFIYSFVDWDGPGDLEENSRNKYDESFIYLNTCKRMGIVPVSYFLRNLTLSEINLKHHGLGARGTKAICVSLTSNSTVTVLNLSDNGLGPSGGIAVADMLKDNCFVSELDLSFNKLGNTGAIALSQVLLENSTVSEELVVCKLYRFVCQII